jgi:hypothetical protein
MGGGQEEKISGSKRNLESKIAEFVNINAANISSPPLKLHLK